MTLENTSKEQKTIMNTNLTNRLSNIAAIVCIFVLLVSLTACGGRKSAYIFVLDLTDSVSAEARTKSFETIKTRAKLLKRGDSMTVIPLTGDAQVETTGKVLHLEVGEKRELADADLDEFFAHAETQLNAMQANAKSYKQSDLLGAMRVAREEVAMIDVSEKRIIVAVLSDMVHSTKEIRFESDTNLAKAESARKYAENLTANSNGSFKDSEVYLGFLESSDLRKMPAERREAVREFWQQYFTCSGTRRLQIATDGTGQLEKFAVAKDKP